MDFDDAVINSLYGAVLHSGKRALHVRSKKLQAYVLDRIKLAELCAEQAKHAGAKIVTGSRINNKDLERFSDEGAVIVGADGGLSAVARWSGFPQTTGHVLTFKEVYENSGYEKEDEVGLFFSQKFSDGFFGWAVPYGGRNLEIGIGTRSGSWNSRSAIERMKGDDMVSAMIGDAKLIDAKASIIPIGTRKYTAKGNVLLVGDAAGQVKATTGGGIIFGGSCAIVAAEAIQKHIKEGKPLELYDKMWRRRYGGDLSMHRIIHNYYSKVGDIGMERMLWLLDALGMGSFLGRYGDMDRPSLILKRFFLRGLAGRDNHSI